MKDIKFRAWDKERKMMCGVVVISFYIDGDGNPLKETEIYDIKTGTGHRKVSIEEIELMQYTGLKDKDGKEIYEGDIARGWGGEYCQGFWEHDEKCVVKWQSNGFYLVSIINNCGCGWGFIDAFENIQVIGNIYDNPSLLEVSQCN